MKIKHEGKYENKTGKENRKNTGKENWKTC